MKAIIAINNKGFIGLDGNLPWTNTQDLLLFKRLTMGSTLLVGHNTYLTLPRLEGRTIVIDHRTDVLDTSNIDWCVGGKLTYLKYQHLFTELHISHIDDDTIGDTFAPEFSRLNEDCKTFEYYFYKKS